MTSLLLSARRLPDGRVVLVGKDGKELPMQVVPASLTGNMYKAFAEETCGMGYQYLLSAASVDVSEAVVEIPYVAMTNLLNR